MANFGNPAASATVQQLPGMMFIASATVGLAQGLFDALDHVADARHQRAYGDALGAATSHAREMEDLARVAVTLVAELEAEVANLKAACKQRQDVILALSGRE